MRQTKLEQELAQYNKLMRRCGLATKTLQEYQRMKSGKGKFTRKVFKDPLVAEKYHRPSPQIPSAYSLRVPVPAKKPEQHYTGNNLLGISTMHKSNSVPIFKQSDAEDIAKMRRG
jgi:hypothetical protein